MAQRKEAVKRPALLFLLLGHRTILDEPVLGNVGLTIVAKAFRRYALTFLIRK